MYYSFKGGLFLSKLIYKVTKLAQKCITLLNKGLFLSKFTYKVTKLVQKCTTLLKKGLFLARTII